MSLHNKVAIEKLPKLGIQLSWINILKNQKEEFSIFMIKEASQDKVKAFLKVKERLPDDDWRTVKKKRTERKNLKEEQEN